jgi:hypothetical protein
MDAQTITAEEACEASLRCFRAEIAVPFADRGVAAASHLERIERVRFIANLEPFQGAADDAAWARVEAYLAKIDGYYAEAQRLASEN